MAQVRRRTIRKLRHWKQRYDRNAEFVFRRVTTFAGESYQPGDPVPEELTGNPTKLRRFWESQCVELAEFEEPNVVTGLVELCADDDDDSWLDGENDDDAWLDGVDVGLPMERTDETLSEQDQV